MAMDGYLYAIGGHDGIAAINTVERYCAMSGSKEQSKGFSLFFVKKFKKKKGFKHVFVLLSLLPPGGTTRKLYLSLLRRNKNVPPL